MVFINKILPGLALVALIGVGCAAKPQIRSIEQGAVSVQEEMHRMMAPTVLDAKERLTWSGKFAPARGSNTFIFSLRDAQGKSLESDDLLLEQEKKIHAILVKSDLSGFQHLHPEANRGEWVLPVTLKEAGLYHLYLDYTPVNGERTVLLLPFTVPGSAMAHALPANEVTHLAVSTPFTARLIDAPTTFLTGTTTVLTFELSQGSQRVQEIGPYLGAFGHVVILQQGKEKQYLHVHPVTNQQPRDGRIVFQTNFPEEGRYVAYGQFNIAGALHVFPMTIDVKGSASSTGSMSGMPMEAHH